MSDSVQFKGVESVIKAFRQRDVDAWSLWQKKQFLSKGVGADALLNFLQLIMQSGTNAVYTVKVYEDIDDGKQIKSSTPDDGSFNFRLNSDDQEITNSQYSRLNSMRSFDERLGNIERLLTEGEEEEEEDKPDIIGSMVNTLVNDPHKLGEIIEIGKKLLGLPVSPPAIGTVRRAGTIAGEEPARQQSDVQLTQEEKLQRLGAAIDILEQHDTKLVEHIERLAQIAQRDPKKFASLTAMLELF